MAAILKRDTALNKVGAFEGAGYSSTGLYRPMIDCIMFSIGNKPYCKKRRVCHNIRTKWVRQINASENPQQIE